MATGRIMYPSAPTEMCIQEFSPPEAHSFAHTLHTPACRQYGAPFTEMRGFVLGGWRSLLATPGVLDRGQKVNDAIAFAIHNRTQRLPANQAPSLATCHESDSASALHICLLIAPLGRFRGDTLLAMTALRPNIRVSEEPATTCLNKTEHSNTTPLLSQCPRSYVYMHAH